MKKGTEVSLKKSPGGKLDLSAFPGQKESFGRFG
jgi:hypothetical protein